MTDRHEAQSLSESPVFAVTFMQFAEMAKRLATAVTNPSGMVLEQFVKESLEVALDLSGAAVASCRRVRFKQEVELVDQAVWAFGINPVGEVARLTHQDDCRPNAVEVEAWGRTDKDNKN
ncbi:MAG: hypothetical protein ABI614_22730, partial [Planctomycetota bacterium]